MMGRSATHRKLANGRLCFCPTQIRRFSSHLRCNLRQNRTLLPRNCTRKLGWSPQRLSSACMLTFSASLPVATECNSDALTYH